MTCSFHQSIPTAWQSDIRTASTHLRDNAFATKLDYYKNSDNQVSVNAWPPEIYHAGEMFNFDTCDYAMVKVGDIACAWPVGTSGVGLWAALWGGGIVENLYRVKIAFDPDNVWDDPSAIHKVVKGAALQNPGGAWPSSRVEKVLRHA